MAYTQENRDIVISGWENGISNNPYTGIYDMRNVDASTIQGEVSVAMKTEAMLTQTPIVNEQITYLDDATDTFGYNGTTPLEVNTCITFTTTDTLPTGLDLNTCYWIKTYDNATKRFTISAVSAGGAIRTFTGTGTGAHYFSTINMGTPLYFTHYVWNNYYKNYFVGDSNGRIWLLSGLDTGNTGKWIYMKNKTAENSTTLCNFLIYWKGYLCWFTSSTLYVHAIGDPANSKVPSLAYLTNGSWTTFQTIATTSFVNDSKYAIVDIIDGSLRFCNDRNIGSLAEIDGQTFHPVTGVVSAADGSTTNTDKTITTTSNFFTSAMLGSNITGTNIPAGAYITEVTSATSAEISSAAIGTASSLTFTIPTSYTFNANSWGGNLPEGEQANCLAMLGQTLLVGGNLNYIYPWDRISDSYSTPIYLSENFVSRMVTVNTTTYIFAGFKGRIYMTNGSNVSLFKEIPDYLSETTNPYFKWHDAIFNRNNLYFSFAVQTNSGTTINEYGGLWAIDLSTEAIILQNQLSYGTYSGYAYGLYQNTSTIRSQTFSSNDGYGLFIGWYDGTKGGVDKTISTPYTTGVSYIISDMIPVGQFLTKRTFENVEYKLSNPLVSGETVALSYRTNIIEDFTDIPITQGGSTGDLSGIGLINFENAQWVQLKATLTSTATTPSYCRLREIRIR